MKYGLIVLTGITTLGVIFTQAWCRRRATAGCRVEAGGKHAGVVELGARRQQHVDLARPCARSQGAR